MTTFFPSILLIAITYATTFFKPFFFEAALTVNLTVMLVITTLFISVMNKLAPTSYIKWIEFWLIFAQLIPFTEVVLLTILEQLRDDENHEVNHHGQSVMVGKDLSKGEEYNNKLFDKIFVLPDEQENMANVSKKYKACTAFVFVDNM